MKIKKVQYMEFMTNQLNYLFKRLFISLKNESFLDTIKKIINTFLGKNKIDLDKLSKDFAHLGLDDLFLVFGTDKGKLDGKKTYYNLKSLVDKNNNFKNYYSWIKRRNFKDFKYQLGNNFSPVYEKLFKNIKDKKNNVLEIGVANGHSLASWYLYFKNSNIFGIDIKKKDKLFYKGNRLQYYSVDTLNEKRVSNFLKKNINFDVIIDDSNHNFEAFFKNIKNFYPLVKPGGLYILEDFVVNDKERQAEIDFNLENGYEILSRDSLLTVESFFNQVKHNKEFKNSFYFTDDEIKEIINSTENTELIYTEHPGGSMAVLYKK